MMKDFTISNMLDLNETIAAELFEGKTYPWEVLPEIGEFIIKLGKTLDPSEYEKKGENVWIANYNCPGQIVITGEETAVAAAGEALKAAGARRVIPLKVSGPFHCELLKGAGEKLGQELEKVEIQPFTVPYVTNVTAQYVTGPEQVKELLVSQVSSSVRWQQCVEQMIDDGVDTFIEIGPGKTLTGFLKKINRNVKALHVEKTEDLDEVRKECLFCNY